MSSEVIIACNLCRGKVFLYKQQLLNRFSNDHIPVAFGVDYSSKIKFQKSDSQIVNNKSTNIISNIDETHTVTDLSPETRKRNEIQHETFETVSKIKFQKSPSVNRKVIQIASKTINHKPRVDDNQQISQQLHVITPNSLIQNRYTNYYVGNSTKECPSSIEISCLNYPLDKNIRVKDNHLLSSDPEMVSNSHREQKMEKLFRLNKTSSMDQYSSNEIKSDTIDPTLLSVAQRAKSLMSNKTSQSVSRPIPMNPLEMQSENNDESVLSIKDRIKLFKESLNQSVTTPTRSDRPHRYNYNRLKTQPLSFDDIARANAMILDQSEVGSTIASPSITNSNETLIDFSEDSNSSSNKINENQKPRKSNVILRTQSCLVNQESNFQTSNLKEEITHTIKVQDFIKNCDKNDREISHPKLPANAVVSRKLAFKIKTEKEQINNKTGKVYTKKAHLTQPITKYDIENSNMNISETNESIKDRISKIRMEGENNWKNRLHKPLDIDSKERPGSVMISTLQEQLKFHNNKWKDRVEQKDVSEFTASSRLYKSMRSNKITKRYTIHGQASKDDLNDPYTVVRLRKCSGKDGLPPKQTLISDIVVDDSKSNYTQELNHSDSATADMTKDESLSVVHSQKVKVPHISDQSLSNFFRTLSSSPEQPTQNTNFPTNDDFDEIFLKSDLSLNINKRTIKPNRRQKNTSRNPLKKLNERLDINDEYNEIITGIAEREVKRCHIENIQAKAGFAEEALAGLSTKEDFSKIKLKRTESSKSFEQFVSPYKDLMLISVKGRRYVQVRLVEPVASSINLGDCYILLTKQDVFIWIGECSNVIEANKANELGSWIAKCKDLNYSGTSDKPIVIKQNESDANELKFWNCLQYADVQNINPPGDISEDELYEQMIQRTNIVYKVIGNQLVPYDKYWGTPLTHQILSTDKVFIFDFGTELYLWSGFKADKLDKYHGRNFLKMLYFKGYNYEECSINPLDPLPNNLKDSKPRKGTIRPNWTIVGRLSQKGETTLFKEKFTDWPEISRFIESMIKSTSFEVNKSLDGDLDPVDINNLLKLPHPNVHLTIDGKSVGRGGKWKVIDDGILREFSVTTKNISMWHITDNEAVIVDRQRMGQFFSCDAYIIRWDYELKTHGRYTRNTKSGNISSGFFFWQGSSTSINEKTASALLTINLDTDRCAQIRVKQHHESPAFCRLFDGAMIIYTGKQRSFESVPKRRLFIIRGEIESESHFVEVVCESQSLRSRSVFMLLNNEKKKCYIWIGNLASEESKSSACYCLKRLKEKKPVDLCINFNDVRIEEIAQGRESRTFWEDMGILRKWKSSYKSNSLEPIRGWYVSPSFILTELVYSLYPENDNIISAFPLLQPVLYKASQPALFLIWSPSKIYIWEGWWIYSTTKSVSSSELDSSIIDEDDINLSDSTLPQNRIAAEKLALLKSVHSWLTQSEKDIPASIVYAGLEPLSFQELFPFWTIHEEARNINIKRGHTMYQEDDICQTLNKYQTMTYSVDVLRQQPLPENVIPTRIESYLTDESFEDLFKMTKDDFYDLSPWKQKERKKEVNLF